METALAGLVKHGRDSQESNMGKIIAKPQQNVFPPDPSEEPDKAELCAPLGTANSHASFSPTKRGFSKKPVYFPVMWGVVHSESVKVSNISCLVYASLMDTEIYQVSKGIKQECSGNRIQSCILVISYVKATVNSIACSSARVY